MSKHKPFFFLFSIFFLFYWKSKVSYIYKNNYRRESIVYICLLFTVYIEIQFAYNMFNQLKRENLARYVIINICIKQTYLIYIALKKSLNFQISIYKHASCLLVFIISKLNWHIRSRKAANMSKFRLFDKMTLVEDGKYFTTQSWD